MLLLIDAGNTRIKWAIFEDARGDWLASGTLLHVELDQLAGTLAVGLAEQSRAESLIPPMMPTILGPLMRPLMRPITQALISNVAGAAVAAQLTQQLADCGIASSALEWFQSSPDCAGVHNGYRQPQQLGSDRFASLIGARHLFPEEDLLVVTCGTATTVDALQADGHFIGGMILPGLGTMAQSLAVNTAQLPQAMPAATDSAQRLFADNTQDAIISGCISAQVGAITRALAAHVTARCIISGGAAAYIAPHLPPSCEQVDNLVLIGLAASLAFNQQEYKPR